MSEEQKSIHEFDLNLICEYFSNLERQGPGSPEIDTIPQKVKQIQNAGYMPVATFILPENCWIEHYYTPHGPVQVEFLKKYAGNQAAQKFVEYQRHEVKLYNKYKQFYGYVFYIGKRIQVRKLD